MRCGGARTSDPILLYVSLNAGSRRANNTFTKSWIDSLSDTTLILGTSLHLAIYMILLCLV
jgi:hypothetical protein